MMKGESGGGSERKRVSEFRSGKSEEGKKGSRPLLSVFGKKKKEKKQAPPPLSLSIFFSLRLPLREKEQGKR
jgi:hypothetical protein